MKPELAPLRMMVSIVFRSFLAIDRHYKGGGKGFQTAFCRKGHFSADVRG
jgi:hypothetical protein